MVPSFRARQYPAGREVNPRDQSLPNGEQLFYSEIADRNCAAGAGVLRSLTDTPNSNTEQPPPASNYPEPTDVPPADGDPTAGGDPNSSPTATAPSPDVLVTTDVPAQPMVILDPSPDLSNPQPTTTDTPGQEAPPPEPINDPNQWPANQ